MDYNDLSQMTHESQQLFGGDVLDFDYVYTGLYLSDRIVHTNTGTPLVTSYGSNAQRRRDSIATCADDGNQCNSLTSFTYGFDAVGNRMGAEGNVPQAYDLTYRYDDLHRLIDGRDTNGPQPPAPPQDGEVFTLDRLSNRTNYDKAVGGPPTSIPYGDNNKANEYSTIDGVTVLYDAAGNLYEDEDDYRFFYDFENRLIRIEKFYSGGFGLLSIGGGGPGGTWTAVAIHEYDALGRRIQTITSNGLFAWGEIFYYDGQRVLSEYSSVPNSGTGTLATFFIDGPTYIDEHLVMHNAATGDEYYYLPRELHTVAGLADASGALKETYAYDAYGAVSVYDALGQWQPTSTVGNPYYFTGRRLDTYNSVLALPRLDLYHSRARAYDPRDGRFYQRDPLGYVDGMNLYEYVSSRPGALLDPLGAWQFDNGKRDASQRRAVVVAEEGDNVSSLSTFIRLDAKEYRQWLSITQGGPPLPKNGTSRVSSGCKYSVPNTIKLIRGQFHLPNDLLLLAALRSARSRAATNFNSKGFFTVRSNAKNKSQLLGQLNMQPDMQGFAYFGHGSGFGLLNPSGGKRGTGKKLLVGAKDLSLSHKLAGIGLVACFSAEGSGLADWQSVLAPNGRFLGFRGTINCFGRPADPNDPVVVQQPGQ